MSIKNKEILVTGGAGYMMKMKQKELALAYGYRMIAWTFDPVMSLNGYFNMRPGTVTV